MSYFVGILVLVNLYVILAVSFNILLGYAGLFSVAHASFYGIGAYLSAILAKHLGLPIPLAVLTAVLGTALVGLILAVPALRVSGDYLVIATLGFQVIVTQVLVNLEITGGPAGFTGIEPVQLMGKPLGAAGYALLTGVAALVVILVSRWLTYSPFGRVLKGIREDPVATEQLGKPVNAFKLQVFAITAGMAALAGALYAHYYQYLSPYDYQIAESVLVISMVVVGGLGTLWGPVLGALILVALPEALRFLALPTAVAAPLKQILYCIMVLSFLYLRPQGIVGRKGGDRTVGADKAPGARSAAREGVA